MSGPSTPASGRPEKTMSSRLLTMKFMQRAAASSSSPKSSPSETHSHKRRKIGDNGAFATPSTPATPSAPGSMMSAPRSTEGNAVSAALASEDQARRQALAKHGHEFGETQWTLDVPGIRLAEVKRPEESESEFEPSDDEFESEQGVTGRMVFGNFKRKKSGVNGKSVDEDDVSEKSVSEESAPDSDDSATKLRRAQRAHAEQEKKRQGSNFTGAGGRRGKRT